MYTKIQKAENVTWRKRWKTIKNLTKKVMNEVEDHVQDQIHFNENVQAVGIEEMRELEM